MTDYTALVKELRAIHRRVVPPMDARYTEHCAYCDNGRSTLRMEWPWPTDWPCDAARAADAIEALTTAPHPIESTPQWSALYREHVESPAAIAWMQSSPFGVELRDLILKLDADRDSWRARAESLVKERDAAKAALGGAAIIAVRVLLAELDAKEKP